ncbi:glycosyltransferase family 2 protein [Pseudodesulfovibrio sp.]|uniref:glycosyltransferase family 2 protein n=1 Tax=unclassified Pseudodesulfovibrio TaxID=2661612 RepID=UPI003B0035C8
MTKVSPEISLIVPCFNEEEALPHFFRKIFSVLEATKLSYELIMMDDGSSDNTPNIIALESGRNPSVKGLVFSRNFGKEAAISAGLEAAKGNAVIIMDSDLQHPPELIPLLIEKWQEGYDMVIPCNHNRAGQSWLLKLFSRLFYSVIKRLAQIDIPPSGSDFRLMDRKVVDAINSLPERNRFMKGIYAWSGFETLTIPYETRPREYGQAKWNFWKRWNFALDGIFAYSSVPLRIWTYIGFVIALASIMWAFWVGIDALLFGVKVTMGITTTTIMVLFLNGLLMISIGIIGEYVCRIFEEVKQRPIYIIKRKIASRDEE